MKLTKKLLPALGMLALSASMLVTSTFAWFSMNTEVKATGMSVTAQGEQVYLQIIAGEDANDFEAGAAQTSATAETPNAALLPTNVYSEFKATNPAAYDGGENIVWVSAVGKKPSAEYTEDETDYTDGYMPVGEYTDVSTEDGYYHVNTFSIRLDPTAGAANSTAPLRVRNIAITNATSGSFSDCLSVLVVCTYNDTVHGDLWSYDGGTFKHDADTAANLTTGNLLKNTVAKVDVYVFFNGDHPSCTLEELADATGKNYGVEVTFTCVA